MKIETLKKAEEFKQGHLNLVQYFLKRGCTFSVDDLETEIKKEKNKKLIKQAAITALCLVVVFVLYKKLAK